MNFYHFIKLNWRNLLIFFVGIVLMIALLWGSEHQLAWAAPEQNPHLQTVPPRPTETPPPNPTRVSPPTVTSENDSDNNDGNDDGDNEEEEEEDSLSPTRTPDERDDQSETESTGASEPDDNDNPSSTESSQPEEGAKNQAESSGQPSPQTNTGGNSVVPATPQQADLSVIQWLTKSNPNFGETITLTAVISNSGPSRATNVIVRNLLPDRLVLSSTLASRGSYDADQGLWIIGTIGRNSQVTASWVLRVAETDPITITAEVIAVDQFDPDSTPDNNLEIEDDLASVSLIPSVNPSLASQSQLDLAELEATPAPTQETLALSNDGNWLYWVFALVVGIVFVIIGVQLVHRS